MTSEFWGIIMSLLGIGFTLDSRFTKKLDDQNIRIEALFKIVRQNSTDIHDLSIYLKTSRTKLEEIEKDVRYIFDLNGHRPNRVLKNDDNTDDNTKFTR